MDKLRRVRSFVGNINLFDDEKDMVLIDQLLVTRIFLFLLTTTLTIIILFATFTLQTNSVTIHSPSQSDFEKLNENYPSTLSCPCSQTWIRYDRFLSGKRTVARADSCAWTVAHGHLVARTFAR
ncbi:unnamed protein product [Adineta ricciae]|uniref:Uncharacterized protein n=1 Tax=Adineta ricciae TaxID=249248 RepID=A0A815WBU1_ADIRI|nr:unnamed protein product [Adineta ricciae]CAF1649521.1 unnamed protein product [Adineta ricciae]